MEERDKIYISFSPPPGEKGKNHENFWAHIEKGWESLGLNRSRNEYRIKPSLDHEAGSFEYIDAADRKAVRVLNEEAVDAFLNKGNNQGRKRGLLKGYSDFMYGDGSKEETVEMNRTDRGDLRIQSKGIETGTDGKAYYVHRLIDWNIKRPLLVNKGVIINAYEQKIPYSSDIRLLDEKVYKAPKVHAISIEEVTAVHKAIMSTLDNIFSYRKRLDDS